jgi:hypothetical protein
MNDCVQYGAGNVSLAYVILTMSHLLRRYSNYCNWTKDGYVSGSE